MIHILETVYSMPFFIGSVLGAVFWKLYCQQKARWLDRHNELPDGAHHYPSHVSRVWIAALAAILSLGYILLTAQKTQDQTVQLTNNVARCWQEAYQSTRAQIKLNADNDLITRKQQQLQRQFDIETSNWLKDLVNPPGGLANQPANSPDRQVYGLQRTATYQGVLDDLGRQFDDQVHQRTVLDDERRQHPIPEVTCGR